MRPSDWQVLDLDRDPTPGEPYRIGVLARSASQLAEDAAVAERDVRSLAGDGAVLSWIGLAGEAFRGALDDFPAQLTKLADSYEQAGAALTAWAADLDGAQSQADRALALGREARAELAVLTGQLASAQSTAGSASAGAQRLQDVSAGAPPPDPAQVQAAVRSASAAAGRVGALSGQVSDAQGRLEAAKRMAEQARSVRESAGDRAAERLHEASEAGIEPNSWWEDFTGAAARVWDVAVKVATVVAIVVAVIALFVGGPLVWGILLAASLVLLADSIDKYASGEGSLWMVGLNLLGVIPGGRLLTGLGRITRLSRVGTRAMAAGSRGFAAGGRGLAAARTSLGNAATGLRAGLGNRLAVIGGMTGSASVDLLTGGLARIGRSADDFAHGGRRQGPLDGFGEPIAPPAQGVQVWRVAGEVQDDLGSLAPPRGARPFGASWTPKDPSLSQDFRLDAGLPDENPGRFLIEGVLRDPTKVTEVRPALPLHGNLGGWPEYLIDDAADAVDVTRVSGINEPWTRQPGDWAP